MPKELRHHVDLSNNTHDIIEDPDDTDATEDIRIIRTGQILLVFLPNISRW
jgi:hypothetical protein